LNEKSRIKTKMGKLVGIYL